MEEKVATNERVPVLLVFMGGLSFIVSAFTASPWVALIGILDGIHIWNTYPDKKAHWIIPIAMNLIMFLFGIAVFAMSLMQFVALNAM